jgi:uncharacterized protein
MKEQIRADWTPDSIMEFLRQHRDELRQMGVRKIGLFGSYARGEQKTHSDLDFLLTMDNLTWTRWMDVWNFLEDNLGVDVDLVPESDLRPELRPQVMAEVCYVEGL